jgi:DNA invertase Pin-like site-specific DNA recombinase
MSKHDASQLDLTDQGAAYVRVSDDQQDTLRQYEAIHAFERRHGVAILEQHWFKDEGWARDTADRRPDFQRLMKEVESGRVKWVVVDRLDRFGTKSAKQLMAYLYRLEEAGCRLFDAGGREWTGEDDATEITALIEGKKSAKEQREKSHRVLGGKVARARLGEWQGGPVRLGFDVVCYSRETGKELWRVAFEGRDKRLKVYSDGRTERFDGRGNFPRWQEVTEVLRIAPSNDQAKVDAAVSVFDRYAKESISFTSLAHCLSSLGFRTCFGGRFQSHHIEGMLADPIYLGYYTWNRLHAGKFGRYTGEQVVPDANYAEKVSRNDEADWVQSRRLFEPLVDQQTWAAVRRKLARRTKRTNAPRSAAQYLAGLVYCANCGGRMVCGPVVRRTAKGPRKDGHAGERQQYFCGTYAKCCREKRRNESPCLRNGVFQDVLERYIDGYLEETGRRLELLTSRPNESHLFDRLEGQETEAWQALCEGVTRLEAYLAEHHPEDYAAIIAEDEAKQAEEAYIRANPDHQVAPAGTLFAKLDLKAAAKQTPQRDPFARPGSPYVRDCLAAYRSLFDPTAVVEEVERLEAEHDALMGRWADLPTPRAKEKAKHRFAELEARIGQLQQQQEDAAEAVEWHYRRLTDLQAALAEAKLAMRSETGERALRQRSEAIRAVIQRIECTFVATGTIKAGGGKKHSQLATVTFYPVVGDPVALSAESKATLVYSSAHSFI